jgi:hypothetical protein
MGRKPIKGLLHLPCLLQSEGKAFQPKQQPFPNCYDIAMNFHDHPHDPEMEGVLGFLGRFRATGRTVMPTDSGRSALALALKILSAQGFSGTAWVPAYACPSLLPVFRKEGITTRRYGTSSYFTPLFPSPGPGPKDAVVLIHYFGFPNRGALEWLRTGFPENRPIVIEDCAGASLTGSVGFVGDFVLFSFRKFFEVPDGGALVSRFPVEISLPPSDPCLAREREEAFRFLRGRDFEGGLRLLERAEARLEEALPALPRSPASQSWEALKRISFNEEARRRRLFAKELMGRISGDPILSTLLLPLFRSVPEEAAPLLLPVKIGVGRERLSRLLREAGFECPFLWDLNPALRYSFPAEYQLGQRTIGLPIPSRERMGDLSAIWDCLKIFASRMEVSA